MRTAAIEMLNAQTRLEVTHAPVKKIFTAMELIVIVSIVAN